ncbi:hypothetical protein ACHHYP_06014 [Achlya hypogyna]|uniref:Transmembrane protein n=1 Tax=Achlya hypogyna TaxID=1202772 RepID=A0A1V9ZNC1_ACHHY|nr:hypothetical protein ACHHYP_06014 [Achlya hypogyna]
MSIYPSPAPRTPGGYHIICVEGSNWISHDQSSGSAALTSHRLYTLALNTWVESCQHDNRTAMYEAAMLLLQWYRTRTVAFPPAIYLGLLTTICVAGPMKLVIDATHSLYNATLDMVTPVELWSAHAGSIDQFAHALEVPSRVTVTKCATTLAMIFKGGPVPTVVPATITKIETAIRQWSHVYRISDSLERIYICLTTHTSVVAVPKQRFMAAYRLLQVARTITPRRLSGSGNVARAAMESFGPPRVLTPSFTKRRIAPVTKAAFSMREPRGPVAGPSASALEPPHGSTMAAYGATVHTLLRAKHKFMAALEAPSPPSFDPSVLEQVETHRARRNQFIEILQRAYNLHQDRDARQIRSKRFGFQDAIECAVQLYYSTEECGIHDYVETTLDPLIHEFLEPYLEEFKEYPCSVANWTTCGYHWLRVAPIGSYWCVWIGFGIYMLHHNGALRGLFRGDAAAIHDYVAQGIAIALSQRKYGSLRQQRVQRALRLSAMWAEWLEFTLAPLEIAFEVTGAPAFMHSIILVFNFSNEAWNLLVALGCGALIFVFHWVKPCHSLLDRLVYPLAFDLLYIPMVSTFLRLGTCPVGLEHVKLPHGFTCDCVDRFGLFWGVGVMCFVLHYSMALYHKMNIEPLATTMDFRFQPRYQFFIVMARTLCPILSILVINIEPDEAQVIAILAGLLVVWTFLLAHTYKTQPVHPGSGSSPNNLRVVTFSGAIYTTLVAICVLVVGAPLRTFLIALTPLPGVWYLAWHVNHQRARRFHVPNVSILELLQHPLPMTKTVGAVAALYMNPAKVIQRDHERIVAQLRRLAATSDAPSCRIYALRTLWFCHIEVSKRIHAPFFTSP